MSSILNEPEKKTMPMMELKYRQINIISTLQKPYIFSDKGQHDYKAVSFNFGKILTIYPG